MVAIVAGLLRLWCRRRDGDDGAGRSRQVRHVEHCRIVRIGHACRDDKGARRRVSCEARSGGDTFVVGVLGHGGKPTAKSGARLPAETTLETCVGREGDWHPGHRAA